MGHPIEKQRIVIFFSIETDIFATKTTIPHLQLSVQAVEFSGLTDDDLSILGVPKYCNHSIHFDTIR